jgi:benzoyl-CoA reductase/2-hydroxyglutaryl-CoA dehydratase subunit BcrC/BadD/HgdB
MNSRLSATVDGLAALQEACRHVLPAEVDLPGRAGLAGVTCSYAPLELLHAARLSPVRLHAPGRPAAAAASWLPPFVCAPVRGLLGAALEGRLDALAVVVLPHGCDAMQELAGIWRALRPDQWILTPVEPLAVERHEARAYLRQELVALAGRLAERLGRPVADDDLSRSIALYNRLRRALQRVDYLRDRLTAVEGWAATSAAWRMPPETYLGTALALVEALQRQTPRPARGPAVILAGSVLEEPSVPTLVDELGGRVVGDDLCNGTRDAWPLADETGDPWSALAERMLRRPPCPGKCAPGHDAGERLVGLARERGAHGVIEVLAKFCDPHGFETVRSGQALAAAGMSRLVLETDATNAPEQLRTRVQAFVELLAMEG